MFEYGEWCPLEIHILKPIIKNCRTIIDIGANIGTHTIAFSKIAAPDAKIFSFEPNRQIYTVFQINLITNNIKNVVSLHAAVSDNLNFTGMDDMNTDINQNFGDVSVKAEQPDYFVQSITIDSFINKNNVDFIKIDTQGSELSILCGARKTLEENHPILFVENDTREKSPELISKLFNYGYTVYWCWLPSFIKNNYKNSVKDIFDGRGRSLNLLCIPQHLKPKVSLFRKAINIDEWWCKADKEIGESIAKSHLFF